MSKKMLFSFILFIFTASISFSEDTATDYLVQSSLKNGITVTADELKFTYSIRSRNADNQLQYTQASNVYLNNKLVAPVGKSYYIRLTEGKNVISIQSIHNNKFRFDTYYYYLDTTPPYINVRGIYNYMTSSTTHINFSVKVGDALSVPEALRLQVFLNNNELTERNGQYHGILKQSLANYSGQKEETNDNHPTDNLVRIEATDAQGHQSSKSYHITYAPNAINYNQLRYLIEKVPGLISQNELYDPIGRYSPVGVALDDSNITVLGTFGGYVVLGHDAPIYNLEGDDFVVNAHWSDQDIPLTSVMVMEDSNGNHRPDDTWYWIKDSFGDNKEGKNYKVTYSFEEKGQYKTGQGSIGQLRLEVPVTTPLASPYLQMAKDLHWKQFRPTYYSLYGNIKYMHQAPIKSVRLNTKGYNIDNAQNDAGESICLSKIDFVKVYSNTLDTMAGLGSVMPAVNYVMPLKDQPQNLTYNANEFIQSRSNKASLGDLIHLNLKDDTRDIKEVILTQTKALVGKDHVFIYPEDDLYNNLPYKLKDQQITLLAPYNRAQLSIVALPKNEHTEKDIDALIQLYKNLSDIKTLEWLDLIRLKHTVSAYLTSENMALTTIQEGRLELLKKEIEGIIYSTINSAIAKLNNSNDKILQLKWMTDFLSDEEFNALDDTLIEALDNRLLNLCEYEALPVTLSSKNNTRYVITPVKNIGYTLSLEEYERGLTPELLFTQRDYTSATNPSDLSFDISFRKNTHKVTELYRPITYKLEVSDTVSTYELYAIKKDSKIRLPIEWNQAESSMTFSTSTLGEFLLVKY